MTGRLRRDEVIAAQVVVRAEAQTVYDLVSDVTRIPQWSPECVECRWTAADRFRGSNRRRFGRWSTNARVVAADRPARFSFVVEAMGGDFTQWTYSIEPGPEPGTCVLSEEIRMCVDLPWGALAFERLFLRVRDRRSDLRENLAESLERIRRIVEVAA